MRHAQERLGFFNARLWQRINELGLSVAELASSDLTYEQVRKLRLGHCLPSPSSLERLCAVLKVNKRDMSQRVVKDRMILKFGDAVWNFWGINPKAAPLYILFSHPHRGGAIFRLQIIAFLWRRRRKETNEPDALHERGKLLNYKAMGL